MNKRHYERLLKNGPVEVRCFDENSPLFHDQKHDRPVVWSGVYSEWLSLRQALVFAMSKNWSIYTTLNPVNLPVTNGKLRPFQKTAKDADVGRLNTIFFDFDPVAKPADEESRDAAFVMAVEVALYLNEEGWSKPCLCDSGNGTHLLYSVDMPVVNLRGLYQFLKREYSNDLVNCDAVVYNPARITRAYGTINQKGGRQTSVTDYNDQLTPESVVMATLEKHKPVEVQRPKRTWVKPPSAGGYIHNLNVLAMAGDRYLQSANEPGKHWIECPWANEHSFVGPTDTVIWEGEWPQFHCSHNSCSGRDITDLIAFYGEKNVA